MFKFWKFFKRKPKLTVEEKIDQCIKSIIACGQTPEKVKNELIAIINRAKVNPLSVYGYEEGFSEQATMTFEFGKFQVWYSISETEKEITIWNGPRVIFFEEVKYED